ncbi:hypothetical protein [Rhodopseudomonas sp. B29]|uniref:hypothetical protein n=1 Tax=Rhodopseudomonas sp. B29 TaxID=95607 RepID=UPI0011D1FE4E|nr:hypothetical protein [Rhodopseudomonas sp. B29]
MIKTGLIGFAGIMGTLVGIIFLVLSWVMLAGLNKAHREETGVNMPTRKAMRRIRRNARKKGITEAQAYSSWVKRKQQLAHIGQVSTSLRSGKPNSVVPRAAKLPAAAAKPPRVRAPAHKPFSFSHLEMVAATYGLTIEKQLFREYTLRDKDGKLIANPYVTGSLPRTSFSHRDLEDFLLTY